MTDNLLDRVIVAIGTQYLVDGEIGRGLQLPNALAILAPRGKTVAPLARLLGGKFLRSDVEPFGVVRIDPGLEVLRLEIGELQEQVGEIALGIDDQRRDAVDGGFFQHADAESGLSTARHSDAYGVGDQIFAVVQENIVVRPSEVERS